MYCGCFGLGRDKYVPESSRAIKIHDFPKGDPPASLKVCTDGIIFGTYLGKIHLFAFKSQNKTISLLASGENSSTPITLQKTHIDKRQIASFVNQGPALALYKNKESIYCYANEIIRVWNSNHLKQQVSLSLPERIDGWKNTLWKDNWVLVIGDLMTAPDHPHHHHRANEAILVDLTSEMMDYLHYKRQPSHTPLDFDGEDLLYAMHGPDGSLVVRTTIAMNGEACEPIQKGPMCLYSKNRPFCGLSRIWGAECVSLQERDTLVVYDCGIQKITERTHKGVVDAGKQCFLYMKRKAHGSSIKRPIISMCAEDDRKLITLDKRGGIRVWVRPMNKIQELLKLEAEVDSYPVLRPPRDLNESVAELELALELQLPSSARFDLNYVYLMSVSNNLLAVASDDGVYMVDITLDDKWTSNLKAPKQRPRKPTESARQWPEMTKKQPSKPTNAPPLSMIVLDEEEELSSDDSGPIFEPPPRVIRPGGDDNSSYTGQIASDMWKETLPVPPNLPKRADVTNNKDLIN